MSGSRPLIALAVCLVVVICVVRFVHLRPEEHFFDGLHAEAGESVLSKLRMSFVESHHPSVLRPARRLAKYIVGVIEQCDATRVGVFVSGWVQNARTDTLVLVAPTSVCAKLVNRTLQSCGVNDGSVRVVVSPWRVVDDELDTSTVLDFLQAERQRAELLVYEVLLTTADNTVLQGSPFRGNAYPSFKVLPASIGLDTTANSSTPGTVQGHVDDIVFYLKKRLEYMGTLPSSSLRGVRARTHWRDLLHNHVLQHMRNSPQYATSPLSGARITNANNYMSPLFRISWDTVLFPTCVNREVLRVEQSGGPSPMTDKPPVLIIPDEQLGYASRCLEEKFSSLCNL